MGIIEKTNTGGQQLHWNEWQSILLSEYEGRLAATGAKGYGFGTARKSFIAIFLHVKGFQVSASEILPEAIRIINALETGSSSFSNEYDAIAMMGHRIGMLENSVGLKQYLLEAERILKPGGQIIFTSIDLPAADMPANGALRNRQCQQANLIGPFFAMLRIKADTLKSQAAAANWQSEFIYRQDDTNYCADCQKL